MVERVVLGVAFIGADAKAQEVRAVLAGVVDADLAVRRHLGTLDRDAGCGQQRAAAQEKHRGPAAVAADPERGDGTLPAEVFHHDPFVAALRRLVGERGDEIEADHAIPI